VIKQFLTDLAVIKQFLTNSVVIKQFLTSPVVIKQFRTVRGALVPAPWGLVRGSAPFLSPLATSVTGERGPRVAALSRRSWRWQPRSR